MMKKTPDYEKMSVFEQVVVGLKESIAHARGELTLRTTTLPAAAPPAAPRRVAALRKKLKMSQGVFAAYLNVSPKTVQSWEQGSREPKAGELRLLQIIAMAPDRFQEMLGSGVKERPTRAARAGSARARRMAS